MNMDQPRNIKGKENLGSRGSWWDRRRESVMFLLRVQVWHLLNSLWNDFKM